MRKIVSGIMLTLLLIGMLPSLINVQPIKAASTSFSVVKTKILEPGDNLIHGFVYYDGYLWASTRTSPCRILKIDPETLDYERIILDTSLNDGEALIAADGDIWVILYTSPSKVIRVDPETLAWEVAIAFQGSELSYGSSLEYAFGYLWAGGAYGKIARIDLTDLTYELFSYPMVGDYAYFDALISGDDYIWGQCPHYSWWQGRYYATTVIRFEPSNPSDYTSVYINGGALADDVAFVGGYFYTGSETSPSYVYKISDSLTYSGAEISNTICYGISANNNHIWGTCIGSPGKAVELDLNLNIIATYQLPVGFNDANEIAFTAGNMYVTCWESPAKIVKFSAPASELAKDVIGAGYQMGEFGYNFGAKEFASPEKILATGMKLDCSGLVYWARNKEFDVKGMANLVFTCRTANQQYLASQHVEEANLSPGDLLFFDYYVDSHLGGAGYVIPGQDGHVDHVAMYVGPYQYEGVVAGIQYTGTYDVVESSSRRGVHPETVNSIKTRVGQSAWKGFGRIEYTVPEVQKKITAKSPVDLTVTDPEGYTITKTTGEALGMFYSEQDVNGDGELDDVVCCWEEKAGDYSIAVTSHPDADPFSTYSLEFWANNVTVPIAENVSISAIPSQPYIVTSNETTTIPRLDPHDVGIKWITTSKIVVGQNLTLDVNATVFNYGLFAETFNVTLSANTTLLATFTNITLASRNSSTITFTWNTAGFAKGNYTISAYAEPAPGETYIADNTYAAGIVIVTTPGDVNGDRKVDATDLNDLKTAYGSTYGSLNWNPNCDINGDGKVEVLDLFLHSKNYGKTDP